MQDSFLVIFVNMTLLAMCYLFFGAFVLGRSEKIDSKTEAFRHWDKGRPAAFLCLCQHVTC